MYDEGCSLSNACVVSIQEDANVVQPGQVYDFCCSWMVVAGFNRVNEMPRFLSCLRGCMLLAVGLLCDAFMPLSFGQTKTNAK